MKIKMSMLFGALIIASMTLAACGGATATPEALAATETPVTEVPATEVTLPPVPLRIWTDETYAPVLQDLADEALAEYNLELVVESKTSIPGEFETAISLGQAPDIILISHDQAGALITNGLLTPIDLGNKEADFVPQALEACTFADVLYCLPYATENPGFFYNTELVSTPPTTWEGVVSAGEALKAEGKVEYIMGITGATNDLYPLFTSFGGYLFAKDADGNLNPDDVGIDSEGMIEAVQWLATNAANGNLPVDWDGEKNRALFETGKVPFLIDGPSSLQRYRDAGVPYAITNFPGDGYPFAGTQGFFINAQSGNGLLSQAFLHGLIASEETMLQLSEAGQRSSAYLPAREKVDDAEVNAVAEAGENAAMIPAIHARDLIWGTWNDAVVLARDGKEDPETALKDAATRVRDMVANPLTGMVNIAGSYQAQAGCAADWQPECAATSMTEGEDGNYHSGPFNLTAGDYEAKVALDGSWTINYGAEGKQDGPSYKFSLTADGTVGFTFDPETKLLEIVTN
jgi:arabinogalactan oligomer/maltooligosaccharide transport system substrate-binding protein